MHCTRVQSSRAAPHNCPLPLTTTIMVQQPSIPVQCTCPPTLLPRRHAFSTCRMAEKRRRVQKRASPLGIGRLRAKSLLKNAKWQIMSGTKKWQQFQVFWKMVRDRQHCLACRLPRRGQLMLGLTKLLWRRCHAIWLGRPDESSGNWDLSGSMLLLNFHEGDLSAPGGIIVDTWLTCHNFLSHRVQTAVFCPLWWQQLTFYGNGWQSLPFERIIRGRVCALCARPCTKSGSQTLRHVSQESVSLSYQQRRCCGGDPNSLISGCYRKVIMPWLVVCTIAGTKFFFITIARALATSLDNGFLLKCPSSFWEGSRLEIGVYQPQEISCQLRTAPPEGWGVWRARAEFDLFSLTSCHSPIDVIHFWQGGFERRFGAIKIRFIIITYMSSWSSSTRLQPAMCVVFDVYTAAEHGRADLLAIHCSQQPGRHLRLHRHHLFHHLRTESQSPNHLSLKIHNPQRRGQLCQFWFTQRTHTDLLSPGTRRRRARGWHTTT